jgi:hypothetical protein
MTMTYDAKSRKLVETKGKNKGYAPVVKIEGDRLNELLAFAKADGIELTRKNKAGKVINNNAKVSQAIRMYVLGAVDEFVRQRKG